MFVHNPNPSDIKIHIDFLSKFHYSLYIKGRIYFANNLIAVRNISCLSDIKVSMIKQLPEKWHDGISDVQEFEIQILLAKSSFPNDLIVKFDFADDTSLSLSRLDLENVLLKSNSAQNLYTKFLDMINNEKSYNNILDLGGRSEKVFLNKRYSVLDIVPAKNVDYVCDAHCMSDIIDRNTFDVVFSISVFEHLIMPWKVVIEINRILRLGGIAFIQTHQTVGMHDLPCDYYRFSDTAWKGLFNAYTGFEIIDTALDGTTFLAPAHYADHYSEVEKTVGFEASCVLVKKISEAILDWPLSAKDLVSDFYPR